MQGYYRFPSIFENTIVFAGEDDLWTVPADGGVARRLTTGLGASSYPRYSPDGERIAFTGREEGVSEVYTIPALGGPPERLTFLGAATMVCGWTPAGEVVFATNSGSPFERMMRLFTVSPASRQVRELPVGPALTASFGPGSRMVIGRYGMVTREPAYWKRYRGGTAGDLWIDAEGSGEFERLISLPGNVTHPLWVGDRIFFTSDHEGVGNLYSCTPSGEELTRHTSHTDYYVRHPSSDGRRIVYHAGADLFVLDMAGEPAGARGARTDTRDSSPAAEPVRVAVTYASPRTQRNRKFYEPARYLDEYAPAPNGKSLSLVTRGKPFVLANWQGPAVQLGERDGVRYRFARWLHDGNRIAVISDASGEEALELHTRDGLETPQRLGEAELGLDIGRPRELVVSPVDTRIALSNHRNELIIITPEKPEAAIVDRSRYSEIAGLDWSPDGRWIAYGCSNGPRTTVIRICDSRDGTVRDATRPGLADIRPVFDPSGKYLYFIGYRELNPVVDELQFELSFPRGSRPYALTLRQSEKSPFMIDDDGNGGESGGSDDKADKSAGTGAGASDSNSSTDHADAGEQQTDRKPPEPVEIDFDRLPDRIEAFPVSEGRYRRLYALPGKLMLLHEPVSGMLDEPMSFTGNGEGKATVETFTFETQKAESILEGVNDLELSADRSTMVYRSGRKLRVVKAGEKPDEKAAAKGPGRESGWIDFSRIKASVEPPGEWRQMYRHAWRLQRDHFWTPDLAKVDWQEVYERYLPLLDRVGTRGEFSDLMWEMQGELGTSHAYEIGGDYRSTPRYRVGVLGADLGWDEQRSLWYIQRIVRGDTAEARSSSPLLRPGVAVEEGASLLAIDGQSVSRELSPAHLLVNKADCEIALTVGNERGEERRTVRVRTLSDEHRVRYRDWVERNRSLVHERTEGRAGYVHIPDMGPAGFAEFHRSFLPEIEREGLLVDVRFNRGGFVSALLLEKLARKRTAYVKTRWFDVEPWPEDSPPGPMVALTNEQAGSDGDIFSHSVKRLELGPLIGKRTWGGVVGIWPRETLVDRGVTTQPEFSFWFTDVGWKVENYGTDPDIEVEIAPHDYAAGRDPQLDRGIEELARIITERPGPKPELDDPPSKAPPKLGG